MIYRIDIAVGLEGWNAYSTKQLAWSAIAIAGAIAIVVSLRNYRILFRYTYIFGFAGVALLILPIIPGLGTDANADVWVSLGFFSFQPGELAQISLAIFFARLPRPHAQVAHVRGDAVPRHDVAARA